nr:nucleocapsid-like protein [Phlebovirus sp.]
MANRSTFDDFDREYTAAKLFSCPIVGESREKDFGALVIAGIMRGNNIEKMIRTMAPAGAAGLRLLVRAYGISSGVSPRGNRDTITLSRVAETFPHLTCGFLRKTIPRPVSKAKMNQLMGCDMLYPDYMMHSAFALFIPKLMESSVTLNICQAHLLHQVQFSLCIDREAATTDPELYARCERFCARRKDSNYVPENTRVYFLVEYGALLREGSALVVAPNVAKAADVYRDLKAQAGTR